eukprot:m.263164 g.263164  ORF g.263164 m.263164 type:complete len:810 (+) comp17612_c0_seq24:3784-6213(+)
MAEVQHEPSMLRQLQASLLREQHHLSSESSEIKELITTVSELLHDVSVANLELFWLQQAHRKLAFQQCSVESTLAYCIKVPESAADATFHAPQAIFDPDFASSVQAFVLCCRERPDLVAVALTANTIPFRHLTQIEVDQHLSFILNRLLASGDTPSDNYLQAVFVSTLAGYRLDNMAQDHTTMHTSSLFSRAINHQLCQPYSELWSFASNWSQSIISYTSQVALKLIQAFNANDPSDPVVMKSLLGLRQVLIVSFQQLLDVPFPLVLRLTIKQICQQLEGPELVTAILDFLVCLVLAPTLLQPRLMNCVQRSLDPDERRALAIAVVTLKHIAKVSGSKDQPQLELLSRSEELVKVAKKLAAKHSTEQTACPPPSSLARGLRFDVVLTVQESYWLMKIFFQNNSVSVLPYPTAVPASLMQGLGDFSKFDEAKQEDDRLVVFNIQQNLDVGYLSETAYFEKAGLLQPELPSQVTQALNLLTNCLRALPVELVKESSLLSLLNHRAAECRAQQAAADHVLFSQARAVFLKLDSPWQQNNFYALQQALHSQLRQRQTYIVYLSRCRSSLDQCHHRLKHRIVQLKAAKGLFTNLSKELLVQSVFGSHPEVLVTAMNHCDPETASTALIHNALADIMEDDRCACGDDMELEEQLLNEFEGYLFGRLFHGLVDKSLALSDDRIAELSKLSLAHPDIQVDERAKVTQPWTLAQRMLGTVVLCRAPQEFLTVITQTCQYIQKLLQLDGKVTSADDVMPVLVYVLLKSPILKQLPIIDDYIMKYGEALLNAGEQAYWFGAFQMAVQFLVRHDFTAKDDK